MMSRPYAGLGIAEIRTLFDGQPDNPAYVRQLILELAQRTGPAAQELMAELALHLLGCEESDSTEASVPAETEGLATPEERSVTEELADEGRPDPNRYFEPVQEEVPAVETGSTLRDASKEARWEEQDTPDSVVSAHVAEDEAIPRQLDLPGVEADPVPGLRDRFLRDFGDLEALEALARELEELLYQDAGDSAASSLARDVSRRCEELELTGRAARPDVPEGPGDEEPAVLPQEASPAGAPEAMGSSEDFHVRSWMPLAPASTPHPEFPAQLELERPRLGALEAAASDEEYELHLASCEWDLDPAILIHGAEDIQAREHWQDVLEPFEHQVKNLITFCRRAPVALIADDVGLGKTISAGLILSELMVRRKVRRALVVVPKVVLLKQWRGELEEHFRLSSSIGRGAELSRLVRGDSEIVVTSYDSARNRMDEIAEAGFDMVIFDEAHKLRNLYGTPSPPKTALAVREALKRRAFRYVLMLTATPIHNRLWDLYSLVDLLAVAKGHENPLGTPDAFARRFVADGRQDARVLHPGRQEEFRQILSQYMVRTRRQDADLEFPQRYLSLRTATGGEAEVKLAALVGEFIGQLNPLAQTSVAQALMSSPQALVVQLDNMVSKGTVDRNHVERARGLMREIVRTAKMELLIQLIGRLRAERSEDWRVVIFTQRRATQESIGDTVAAFFGESAVGFIRGGEHLMNAQAIEGYSQQPPQVHVLVSTDAGAEGLNLQAGNVVVNYDLPWNPMVLEQRIGRVQRLGSKHASILVLNLVLAGSVEERVVGRLSEKLGAIAATLGDIEGILESLSGDDGDEDGLEKQIRDLVVHSLQGMDVEASVRRMQQSIERAKQVYEEEKQTVEKNLGRLDGMHGDGPRMPELSGVEPRLSEQAFTLGALQAGAGNLRELGDGRWEHTRAGYPPEEVVFTEEDEERFRERGFAGGARVSLYRSGRPAFEKLSERWRRRAQHAVRAAPELEEERLEDVARAWVASLGADARFEALTVGEVRTAFEGSLVVRSAAFVAHDKYEKLLVVDASTQHSGVPVADLADRPEADVAEESPAGDNLPPLQAALPLDELPGEVGIDDLVQGAVRTDQDLALFTGFYLQRLDEELESCGEDDERRRLAGSRFKPHVSTTVVGAEGSLASIVSLQVRYSFESGKSHQSRLQVETRAPWRVEAPILATCDLTGRHVPEDVLATCERSGMNVLEHLLRTSERSGRRAHEDYVGLCDESGALLLDDELERSEVSGRTVDRELLVPSEVSGRRALLSECVSCEFTGARVLPDELRESQVSGRRYRMDEERTGGLQEVRGHASEFEACSATEAWYLPSELEASDLSGSRVLRDLLVASEVSGRRGTPDEVAACEESGRMLLRDELEQCAVTGKWVDPSLLQASARSGRRALSREVVACEESGRQLLGDEVARCAGTGKRVDVDLLRKCQVSGKRALPAALRRCDLTGQEVLASELGTCFVTGKQVVLARLATCKVTGHRAMATEMLEDALEPGTWILRAEAGLSELSGRPSTPQNCVECQWDGQLRLIDELGPCKLTGVRVGREHLNEDGQLRALARLLETPTAGQPFEAPRHAGSELRGVGPVFRLRDLRAIMSPNKKARACIGTRRQLLVFRGEVVGFLLDQRGRPLCNPVTRRS